MIKIPSRSHKQSKRSNILNVVRTSREQLAGWPNRIRYLYKLKTHPILPTSDDVCAQPTHPHTQLLATRFVHERVSPDPPSQRSSHSTLKNYNVCQPGYQEEAYRVITLPDRCRVQIVGKCKKRIMQRKPHRPAKQSSLSFAPKRKRKKYWHKAFSRWSSPVKMLCWSNP